MEEGFYSFGYHGKAGSGMGAMLFQAGRMTGFDMRRTRYDGTYAKADDGSITAEMILTVPPGVFLVSGAAARDQEYAIPFTLHFPPDFGLGKSVTTSIMGEPVRASFVKMRDL
ncbi:MAG: hypothetical protein JNL66_25500 [Alphaproteobacteria bacterium]|nr:hypothetical protein [Alphaproteobacteria bacterium]